MRTTSRLFAATFAAGLALAGCGSIQETPIKATTMDNPDEAQI